ncbi:hypothetical protein FHY09_000071 [Xanthomonas sp. 60]
MAASIAGSLGNLLMLSGSYNSELSNRPFRCVDGKDKASRYAHGSYFAERVGRGDFYNGVRLDGRNVGKLVERFNQPLVEASAGRAGKGRIWRS